MKTEQRGALATPPFRFLLAQVVGGDGGAVTLDVLPLQIGQQTAALADHLQQATLAVLVIAMDLQMLIQLVDAGGQNGDLDLGRTGVGLVQAALLNGGGFGLLQNHGDIPPV